MDDRGGPVTQTELHQDPREVLGHGVLGDGELGGDLVVPQAAADRGEHLTLLMAELGRGGAEERGGAWSVGGEGRRHHCSPGSGGVGLAGAVDKVFGGEPGKASGTIRSDIRDRVSLPGACRQRTPGPTRWTVPVIKGERTGGSPSRWTSAATPAPPRPVHERIHGLGRRHRAGGVLAGPQDGEGLPQVPHCVRGDRP